MEIKKIGVVPKVWGRERWMVNRKEYCGKILEISQGGYCSLHAHWDKLEDFYVLTGKILFEWQDAIWDDQKIPTPDGNIHSTLLYKGESVNVPRYMLHRFTGLESVNAIIETSTQHFDEDSYRVTTSGVHSPEEFVKLRIELCGEE